MPPRGKMSWKTKALIGFVVMCFVGLIFMFTEWGVTSMRGWMESNYNETPEAERINMSSAGYWLKLCYWEGAICGRMKESNEMYQDFFGIKTNKNGPWLDKYLSGITDFDGKFNPKNKTGWGPMHPKACDAFFDYMEMNVGSGSADTNGTLGYTYFYLFHDWYINNCGGKPHPRFYVHWEQVEKGYISPNHYRMGRPPVTPKPADFEGPENP